MHHLAALLATINGLQAAAPRPDACTTLIWLHLREPQGVALWPLHDNIQTQITGCAAMLQPFANIAVLAAHLMEAGEVYTHAAMG